MNFPKLVGVLLSVSAAGAVRGNLTPEQVERLPAPAALEVLFGRDVKPIFEAACVKCHGKGKAKGGLSIETPALFMKGGETGAPVIPGKSGESLLIELVSGLDPDNVMPKKDRD